MDLGLAGKTAFITGGSSGIGLAIGRALHEERAAVTVCGRDPERLKESGLPGIQADVTDPDALARAVDEAAEQMGGLDLLVANADGVFGGGLLDSTPEDWLRTYELNVLHAAHAIRSAVPHFERRGGGSALIVASITGWKPGPRSSYASAKAAEIHLAAALGQELGPRNIRVNALSPGSVMFEGGGWAWFRDNRPEQYKAFARDDFPRGRLVELHEVADVACFLLSARASGVNGTNICVDGAQDHPSAGRLFPWTPLTKGPAARPRRVAASRPGHGLPAWSRKPSAPSSGPLDHLDREAAGRFSGHALQPHAGPARAACRRRPSSARSPRAVGGPERDQSRRRFLYLDYSHPDAG